MMTKRFYSPGTPTASLNPDRLISFPLAFPQLVSIRVLLLPLFFWGLRHFVRSVASLAQWVVECESNEHLKVSGWKLDERNGIRIGTTFKHMITLSRFYHSWWTECNANGMYAMQWSIDCCQRGSAWRTNESARALWFLPRRYCSRAMWTNVRNIDGFLNTSLWTRFQSKLFKSNSDQFKIIHKLDRLQSFFQNTHSHAHSYHLFWLLRTVAFQTCDVGVEKKWK